MSVMPDLMGGVCLTPGEESSQDGGPSQSRDPEAMAEARVDIRKLQQFLMGQQVNPSKAMCSKSTHREGRLLLTLLYLTPYFTSYLTLSYRTSPSTIHLTLLYLLPYDTLPYPLPCLTPYLISFLPFSLPDIVHHRVVHLILLHEDVSLQYFIPAVA